MEENIDKKDNKYNGSILGKHIYTAARGGLFFSGMVTGPREIGKSSYCLKSLYFALRALGYSEADAWEKCLDSIKFKLSDVVQYLEGCAKKKNREVCLIWDDARIGASGSQWFINQRLCQRLVAVLDTVRSSLASMLLTAPSSSGMLSVLSSYDDYIIKVTFGSRGGMYRRGRGYIIRSLPSGQRRIYRSFEDEFSCRLPKPIFLRYNKMRKQALRDALSNLKIEVKKEK